MKNYSLMLSLKAEVNCFVQYYNIMVGHKISRCLTNISLLQNTVPELVKHVDTTGKTNHRDKGCFIQSQVLKSWNVNAEVKTCLPVCLNNCVCVRVCARAHVHMHELLSGGR